MTNDRGHDLRGRRLRVSAEHQAANPRRPYTHGWLAFEVLRRAPQQTLDAEEYERRLFDAAPEIATLAQSIPGVRDAYRDLKHIRCDIARGHVYVDPPLPAAWYAAARCGRKRSRRP